MGKAYLECLEGGGRGGSFVGLIVFGVSSAVFVGALLIDICKAAFGCRTEISSTMSMTRRASVSHWFDLSLYLFAIISLKPSERVVFG